MFNETATGAVDITLHREFTAKHQIATVHHTLARKFMASHFGITEEQADDIRDLMIEAAEAARVGASDEAHNQVGRMIYDLERLNTDHIDSLRLAKLIERYRGIIEEEARENEILENRERYEP